MSGWLKIHLQFAPPSYQFFPSSPRNRIKAVELGAVVVWHRKVIRGVDMTVLQMLPNVEQQPRSPFRRKSSTIKTHLIHSLVLTRVYTMNNYLLCPQAIE